MNRKKLLAVAAVLFVAAMITGVAAWLSDSETQTDEIVATDLSIVLNEANWRPENASDVHPEDVLPQNPTVTNTGTAPAYVFVEVRMSALRPGARVVDENSLLELQAPTPLYTTRSRGRAFDSDNWQLLIGPLYDSAQNTVTYVYAYGKGASMTPLMPGAVTPAVFDAVQLANVIRRDDVVGLDANVYVHAYAIQASDLGDNGASTAPGAVWNIVRNTYDVQLASQSLPTTSPKVLAVKETPSPTPTASPTPALKVPDEDDWVVEELAEDDAALRAMFEESSPEPTPTGRRSVG